MVAVQIIDLFSHPIPIYRIWVVSAGTFRPGLISVVYRSETFQLWVVSVEFQYDRIGIYKFAPKT